MMIESIGQTPQLQDVQPTSYKRPVSSLTNFDLEDQAIISAQAKILNELEKFNAGEGNEFELAVANITGKIQVEAAVNVIKTKDEMMDTLMEMFNSEN